MLHANSAVAVKAIRAPKLRYMDLSLELIASVRSSEFSHSGSGREAVGGCDGAAAAASAAEGVLETPRTRVARQRRCARNILTGFWLRAVMGRYCRPFRVVGDRKTSSSARVPLRRLRLLFSCAFSLSTDHKAHNDKNTAILFLRPGNLGVGHTQKAPRQPDSSWLTFLNAARPASQSSLLKLAETMTRTLRWGIHR